MRSNNIILLSRALFVFGLNYNAITQLFKVEKVILMPNMEIALFSGYVA